MSVVSGTLVFGAVTLARVRLYYLHRLAFEH